MIEGKGVGIGLSWQRKKLGVNLLLWEVVWQPDNIIIRELQRRIGISKIDFSIYRHLWRV